MHNDKTDPDHSAPYSRLVMALKNASVIARFGRLQPRTSTVYYVARETAEYRLRCYEVKKSKTPRIPILLVPPLMISADVYDMAADNSAVDYLNDQGFSVWLVDFGAPEAQEGGLDRDFSDHILAVNDAIDYVAKEKSTPVHVAGYSQGGIFCYLAAAYRNNRDVASVIGFGSPVNIYKNFIPGISDDAMTQALEMIGKVIPKNLRPSMVPAWASKNLFKLMSPTKEIKNWFSFIGSLHDRDALLKTEEGRSFLGGEGFVAWPGPALQEFLGQMLLGNRLISGGCVIEGRTVSLAELSCPILVVVGGNDEIARPGSVRGIAEAVPNAEIFEFNVEAGHMGIVVGSTAMQQTWPEVASWLRWREGRQLQPETIRRLDLTTEANRKPSSSSFDDALPVAFTKTLYGMGKGALGTVSDLAGITAQSLQNLTDNFTSHVSYLSRLNKLASDSEIGFALALEEQAKKAPKDTYFLYDGRAHTYSDANRRIDNIVRGLISIGVRTGDHVGVLMHARPSSLATIMAVNRLGAVAVLLRNIHTGNQLNTELKLGGVQFLIADPENAELATQAFSGQVHVLGGFGRSHRSLPETAVDMEQIDPASVALPDWYRPSPGKADDTAFVLFSGTGIDTAADLICNRRWALSALGTASATSLMKSDTAYCWTSLHDPTGLMVAVSASLIAGARIAVARKYDAETFWREARRYGAKVVFYAGTMLRELVDAPQNKLETGHSIRMFAGVGMPQRLCERVQQRFSSAKVMEIFVAKDTNAYMANVSCKKLGPVFQTVPGSCEIALVHWNHDKNQPYLDAAGYLCPVRKGTVGMLLTRSESHGRDLKRPPIYNVFEKGDCWQATHDLFVVDEDDEYRFVDKAKSLIRTEDEWLPSLPIETAVWQLDSVSIAAAYELRLENHPYGLPAVALELRSNASLDTKELTKIVTSALTETSRPVVIRIMDRLPMTLGQQVKKQALSVAGLPAGALKRGKSLWLNPNTSHYEPLTATTLPKLLSSLGSPADTKKPAIKTPAKKRTPTKKAARRKKTTNQRDTRDRASTSSGNGANNTASPAPHNDASGAQQTCARGDNVSQTAQTDTGKHKSGNGNGNGNRESRSENTGVDKHAASESLSAAEPQANGKDSSDDRTTDSSATLA